jgi:hypothetical protein
MIAPLLALAGADGDNPDAHVGALLVARWLFDENRKNRGG